MPESMVLLQTNNHIARITLNRPDVKNEINLQMGQELDEICRRINQDNDIYVVILTGAGGSFLWRQRTAGCREKTDSQGSGNRAKIQCCRGGGAIEKPVVAAINGDAMGEGLELALACDVRIAAQNARFGLPEIEAGLIPSGGGTQRLPRIVGRGKALEMILTGETIDAAAALEYGLITKIVPAESLMPEVEALAKAMAAKAPVSLRYIKEAINKGLDLTMEQGLRLEADLYFLLHTTGDRTEGIKAFQQKRPPEFKGQ